jgi:hypothetical protein
VGGDSEAGDGNWTQTDSVRNLEWFLCVLGLNYVRNNPSSMREVVDRVP